MTEKDIMDLIHNKCITIIYQCNQSAGMDLCKESEKMMKKLEEFSQV